MQITTEAVVLQSRKFGDTSKIVRIYSESDGKISLIAKGSRKSKSKFGGALEPGALIRATFYKKASRNLQILSNVEISSHLSKISSSLDKIASVLATLEAVSASQEDWAPNSELFVELIKTLKAVNQSRSNSFSYFVKFMINLAEILGFGMNFESIDENDYIAKGNESFSVENAAFVKSGLGGSGFAEVDGRVAKTMARLRKSELNMAQEEDIPNCLRKDFVDFFVRFFEFHLDRKFAFRSFQLFETLT